MRGAEAALVGRVIAGQTHELLNVLAIVKEAAGLLEDLLALNRDPSLPWHGKADRSLQRIRNQVSRGTELSERLNRFAHSMDEPTARVEVHDLVEQLALLMGPFARLRRVTLRTELGSHSPVISTRPLQLQLVLAACIEQCLECVARDGTMTLTVHGSDTAVAFRIEIEPEGVPVGREVPGTGALTALRDTIVGLSASISPLPSHGSAGVELLLPRT